MDGWRGLIIRGIDGGSGLIIWGMEGGENNATKGRDKSIIG
jgi:hypothetical protein